MALSEEALYNMSDEELEALVQEEQANEANNELDEPSNDEPQDEEIIDLDEDDEEELEQPDDEDEDSDDNAETEENDSDDESEEPDEDTDEPDEEDSEDSEDNSDEKSDDEKEPVQPEQKRKYKANGMEYEFTEKEIFEMFPKVFGQAMDYTKKMQKIKPYRQMIDAIEQAQLSKDDLNLAIDVLKGDKDAIGALLKRTGIDALDLDVEDSNYVPKDYGRDETTLALNDVIEEISADQEYQRTQSILGREWDDKSWDEMTKDPSMIRALHIDVKTGMYDKVQPIAAKLKVYDGGRKRDLDYYKEAAGIYFAQQSEAEKQAQLEAQQQAELEAKQKREAELARVQAEKAKRETAKKKAVKRKKAAPSKVGAKAAGVTDYLDDSDEEFEKWYAQLQEKY